MSNLKLFTLVMLMSLTLGSAAHAEEEFYELSFSTIYTPGQTQFRDVFEGFAKEVEKRSDGSVVINIFGVGTIVGPYEDGPAVKAGNIDMGQLISLERNLVAHTSLIMNLPNLSKTIADTVGIGEILYTLPEIKKETDQYGLPIGFTSAMPLLLVSNNELIKTPADLVGKRMLVMGSAQAVQAEAWGAIPVMVATGDVYIGMQRGMGEAILTGLSWIKGAKLYETAKYMTMLNYPNTTYMPLIINKELFAGLSENQQNIIMETADEYFGDIWLKSWEADYDEALEIFEEAGVEVYYPTEEEMLLWEEANKKMIPIGLDIAEDSGLPRKDALEFLDRAYDHFEANGREVNRYTGE